MELGFKVGRVFEVRCYVPGDKLKWEDTAKNIVTNQGMDHILDVGLTDGTHTSASVDA